MCFYLTFLPCECKNYTHPDCIICLAYILMTTQYENTRQAFDSRAMLSLEQVAAPPKSSAT